MLEVYGLRTSVNVRTYGRRVVNVYIAIEGANQLRAHIQMYNSFSRMKFPRKLLHCLRKGVQL